MEPLPSASQLALALAIVKHKPVNLNIKEYILQIRQCLASTTQGSHDTDNHTYAEDQYFDSVTFWKKAYEKSAAEQSQLLDQIYDLERRNESLLSKVQSRDSVHESESVPKRKRAKTQTSSLSVGAGDIDRGWEFSEESTAWLMRHFYTLQKTLQKKSPASAIVKASTILCKMTGEAISKTIMVHAEKADRPKRNPLQVQPAVFAVFRAAEMSIQLLLQATKKVSTTEATQDVGALTYHLVSLYEYTLAALGQYCKTHCTAGTKAKPKQRSKKAQLDEMDKTLSLISQMLNTMAISLDFSCPAHYSILEGFLFILVSRVGNVLSLFTFQDLKVRPDLDSKKLPLPHGLEEPLPAAQREAKQLVWLLERLLAVLDSSKDKGASTLAHDADASLLSTSRQKIQGTLLKAVFGDDKTWENILRRPPHPIDHNKRYAKITDQSVPDWFTQEMWRLLGWEMLATTGASN
ncbi:hypothetical protein BDV59DRAFT_203638 [Aspergillus ambiguus]|uniref:uncharacterized protein n=1 Tax=Aspergillus ambiguus TaxID=176160 RepID=UPI003CCDDCAD